MNPYWPDLTDYLIAVQNPELSFEDSDLRDSTVSKDNKGRPRIASGSHATVYEFTRGSQSWAVRCFQQPVVDQQRRYDLLSAHLAGLPSGDCLVGFKYIEKGIRVNASWYPIVKMDWVRGCSLLRAVEDMLGYPGDLLYLAKKLRFLAATLHGLNMAHGDLQHGNILVTDLNDLRLVDYDGMFVPLMRGDRSPEGGHPNFAHPLRRETHFDAMLDNFPALVIFLALRALAIEPGLWARFNVGENLLLARRDYEDPGSSEAFRALQSIADPIVQQLSKTLKGLCSVDPGKVPRLEELLSSIPVGVLFPQRLAEKRRPRQPAVLPHPPTRSRPIIDPPVFPRAAPASARRVVPSIDLGDIAAAGVDAAKTACESVFNRARKLLTRSMADVEPLFFTTYHPEQVKPATPYALLVFAHVEDAINEVQKQADKQNLVLGGKAGNASARSDTRILSGESITVVPTIRGIEFQPERQILIWMPPVQSCAFVFTVPVDAALPMHGRVAFFRGPVFAGEVELVLKPAPIHGIAATAPVASTVENLSPVFACYSHRDTRVMEYFRRRRAQLGQNMLVDIYDLRAGQHWQKRLLEMIDDSAAFQLFWSRHTAGSKYCRTEWEHALHVAERRLAETTASVNPAAKTACMPTADCGAFIRPIWWTKLTPPPPELRHLHFERVSVPRAGVAGIVVRSGKWLTGLLNREH